MKRQLKENKKIYCKRTKLLSATAFLTDFLLSCKIDFLSNVSIRLHN